jgi:hypothetical protein
LKDGADARQSTVDDLLGKFHPLKADKYIKGPAPTTQPSAQYIVETTVVSGGGAKTEVHQVRLTDPGQDKPLVGEYKGLVFEVGRTLADSLSADFANKP